MELRVDQFLITSDKFQFVLYEFRKPEGATAKNDESQVFLGYYTTIEPIFLKMVERGIKESTAQTLEDLMYTLKGLRLFVRKASNTVIEAILKMDRSQLPASDPKPQDINELIDEPDPSTEPNQPELAPAPKPKKKTEKKAVVEPVPEPVVAKEEPKLKKQRGSKVPSLSDKLKLTRRKSSS